MTYDVILEIRIRSDRIAALDKLAEKLKLHPNDFDLPPGYREWTGAAVAAMILADEIDECDATAQLLDTSPHL